MDQKCNFSCLVLAQKIKYVSHISINVARFARQVVKSETFCGILRHCEKRTLDIEKERGKETSTVQGETLSNAVGPYTICQKDQLPTDQSTMEKFRNDDQEYCYYTY